MSIVEKYDVKALKKGLSELGLILSGKQIEQLLTYYEMLIEKNKVMNLTAITDFDQVVEKHFLDSLSLVMAMDPIDVETMLDLGTGAGFPGIPLKIAYPHLKVTLVDSLNKRVDFLNEVIKKLNLKNIKAIHGRGEDLAHKKEYREKYDLVVSRAVANLSTLSEYCIPFTGIGGLFISYKGGDVTAECKGANDAIEKLGGVIADVVTFSLPGSDADRSLVVIEKEENTPRNYPRKAGIPEKRPL